MNIFVIVILCSEL